MKKLISAVLIILMCALLSACDSRAPGTEKLTELFTILYKFPNEELVAARDAMLEVATYIGDAPPTEPPTPKEYLTAQQPLFDIFSPYVSPEYFEDFIMKNMVNSSDYAMSLRLLELEPREQEVEYERCYFFKLTVDAVNHRKEELVHEIGGSLRVDEKGMLTNLNYDRSYADFYMESQLPIYANEPVNINFNSAPPEMLKPFIGDMDLAESIVKHRGEHGYFQGLEDLREVEGMTDEVMEWLSELETAGVIDFSH